MPLPPRHECSSEVRRTRHPFGLPGVGQSRQMAARGGGKKCEERGGGQAKKGPWSRRRRERGRDRERRAQLTFQLERGAFPAGQWRGTIMTGFRIKRCATSTKKRRCGGVGGQRKGSGGCLTSGLTDGNCRSARPHRASLGRPTATPGREKKNKTEN